LPILLGTIIFIVGRSFGHFQSTMEETLLIYSMGLVLSTNPGASALITQYVLLNYGSIGTFSMTLDNGDKVQLISPWIPFTILYLTLTVVFFLLAVRQVRKIEE
jgi:succinate-acetate transporter protein